MGEGGGGRGGGGDEARLSSCRGPTVSHSGKDEAPVFWDTAVSAHLGVP